MSNSKKINHHQSDYIEHISQNVFFSDKKWPQFKLLLNDLALLSNSLADSSSVLSLERNTLYGNISLFAPLFDEFTFHSVDLTPAINKARGAYNKDKIDDYIVSAQSSCVDLKQLTIEQINSKYDLILVPNLLHHYPKPSSLFELISSSMSEHGQCYIFDSTVREWHQEPDDYYRMTPYAIAELAKEYNMKVISSSNTGGVFTSIAYYIDQAMQYIPPNDPNYYELLDWLNKYNVSYFDKLDRACSSNLVRPSSSSPTAYSCILSF